MYLYFRKMLYILRGVNEKFKQLKIKEQMVMKFLKSLTDFLKMVKICITLFQGEIMDNIYKSSDISGINQFFKGVATWNIIL